jgi:hypothetical protein
LYDRSAYESRKETLLNEGRDIETFKNYNALTAQFCSDLFYILQFLAWAKNSVHACFIFLSLCPPPKKQQNENHALIPTSEIQQSKNSVLFISGH